jgi:hypothetical protein
MSDSSSSGSAGIGVGSIIAAILSWKTYHDILWMVVHAILGWLYIFYWIFVEWK